jgi:hypothetical protein
LLRQAEETDHTDTPDRLDIPEELSRRNEQLVALAKAEIEQRAAVRPFSEQAERQRKLELLP